MMIQSKVLSHPNRFRKIIPHLTENFPKLFIRILCLEKESIAGILPDLSNPCAEKIDYDAQITLLENFFTNGTTYV